MFDRPMSKSELLLVVLLQGFIVFNCYIVFKPRENPVDPEIIFEYYFVQRIQQITQEYIEKAEFLSQNGQQREAALLLFQVAAAEDILYPKRQRIYEGKPTLTEKKALRQYEAGSKEKEQYIQVLKWKYPEWDERDGRLLLQ